MKSYISYVGHCIQDCGFYINTYQNFDHITNFLTENNHKSTLKSY